MNYSHRQSPESGFTLIELITALVIVMVLSAIAFPTCQHFLTQARRAEAKSALLAALLQEERFFTLHGTYFGFDASTPDLSFKWWSGDSAETSYYEIQASPCPGKTLLECVLLTALPGTENVRSFDDPACGKLMVDSSNNKSYSVSPDPNPVCW